MGFSWPVRTNAGITIRLAQARVALNQIRRVGQWVATQVRDKDLQIPDVLRDIARPDRVAVFYPGALSHPLFKLLFELCELAGA